MFTQYKFSPADISKAAVQAAKSLATARPGVNPAQFAARTIADRLHAAPAGYLQYGPYWWAVKAALVTLGHDLGPTDDAGMRLEYGAGLPAYAALVAGERFRDFYRSSFLEGSAQFWLDDEGEESYVLFDPDMEALRLGRAGREVASLLSPVAAEEVGAVLDSVGDAQAADLESQRRAQASLTPFDVQFEFEASLWSATIYAMDFEHAEAKMRALQQNGRIGGAIEQAKSLGEPALDSADYDHPLFVDVAARRVAELENVALPS